MVPAPLLAASLAVAMVASPLAPGGPLAGFAGAAPAHAQAGGETNLRRISRLRRAGVRGGRYCAFYKGRNTYDTFPLAQSFQRRACFTTANACRSWFYKVQTAFPIQRLRKPCRRVG